MSCAASICASAARYAASSPRAGSSSRTCARGPSRTARGSRVRAPAQRRQRDPLPRQPPLDRLLQRLHRLHRLALALRLLGLLRPATFRLRRPRRLRLRPALSSAVGAAAAAVRALSSASASTAAAQSFDVSLARSAVLARSRRRAASRLWLSAYNSFVARTRPALSVGLAAFVAPAAAVACSGPLSHRAPATRARAARDARWRRRSPWLSSAPRAVRRFWRRFGARSPWCRPRTSRATSSTRAVTVAGRCARCTAVAASRARA